MKDVAARAGVALKTVSRVVNGESGVTPATAERVLGAIEELGFAERERPAAAYRADRDAGAAAEQADSPRHALSGSR
jgi:LacI family transcriptional regulator